MAPGFAPGRASEIGSVYGRRRGAGFRPPPAPPSRRMICRQSLGRLELRALSAGRGDAFSVDFQLEDELLAVLVVPLRAGLAEAEAPDERERRLVPRADGGDEVAHALLRLRPAEDPDDRLRRVALPPEGLEHRVADLERVRLLRAVHA